ERAAGRDEQSATTENDYAEPQSIGGDQRQRAADSKQHPAHGERLRDRSMNHFNTLSILQYSIRNSRDIVMATLLRDPQIHEYNILAIQEPWRNPYTATTHHPAKDIFHLCYPAAADEEGPARVCFFVNKRIDHNRWHFKEHSRDICSLVIEPSRDQQEQQSVAVHNIYNAVGGGGP
ncbi:hypothetical protein TUN199_10522, partial [Pyrenophora tritici-repentis]